MSDHRSVPTAAKSRASPQSEVHSTKNQCVVLKNEQYLFKNKSVMGIWGDDQPCGPACTPSWSCKAKSTKSHSSVEAFDFNKEVSKLEKRLQSVKVGVGV